MTSLAEKPMPYKHNQSRRHKIGRDHTLVGDQNRASNADPRALRRQLRKCVIAEVEMAQVVDVGAASENGI